MTVEHLKKNGYQSRLPVHSRETILRKMFIQAISESGFSNLELAERSGLAPSTISNLMCSVREGKISTWEKVLEAANVEIGFRQKAKS